MLYDPNSAPARARGDAAAVALSVVVPVRDEAENIGPLIDEIDRATRALGACEIICVDDGSIDGSAQQIASRRPGHATVRLIRHETGLGQSAALRSGVLAARAPLVVTMDGDGQNDPADIPGLLAEFRAAADPARLGMVAGVRAQRHDAASRRIASRVANGIRARLLRDGAVDTGCGLRLVRRDVYALLPFFDHQHRFLPALVRTAGYQVLFRPVGHRPRRHGRSKYGIVDRLCDGVVDLAGVMWLQRRYRYFPGCGREEPTAREDTSEDKG